MLFITTILGACSPESTTISKYPTNTPPMLRAINNELLSVDVQVDNTGPIYKGEQNKNGNWDIELNISLDTNHSFVAKWFVTIGPQRLLVLEQHGNFYSDSTTNRSEPTFTENISAGDSQFDLDCDGMSNLQELVNLNTDPLSPLECGTTTTPENPASVGPSPEDAALDNNISTNIPDAMPLRGGCFNMGSPEFYPEGSNQENVVRKTDERQHSVCVDPFSIGIYEITLAQWSQFDNSRRIGNNPIRNITRQEVDAYTTWLPNETGDTYRLPTEAEWEYAARGGKKTRFWSGHKLADNQENYIISNGNLYGGAIETAERLELPGGLLPVGSLQANPFGLYDMLGNAMEHTCSAYSENYDRALAFETYCSADSNGEHVYRSGDQK